MIRIFKLANGIEVMGRIDPTVLTNTEEYVIMHPMQIVSDDEVGYGAMRLRDALLLSDEDALFVPKHFCVYSYAPSKVMTEYYNVASVYYTNHTKKDIEAQISEATMELKYQLTRKDHDGPTLGDLVEVYMKKGKLH